MLAAAAATLCAQTATAETTELKLSYFITQQHPMSQFLHKWGAELEKKSNGRLKFSFFPNQQMGPTPRQYELVRSGQADIAWFLHGGTPGLFPLTDLSNLPYMVASAEVGAKMLNDPELRAKYLDAEHKGVKVLWIFTHQPGQIHFAKDKIQSVADIKGKRIRFSTPTVREFITALGATPQTVPPTGILEALQKGTIDGAMIDYGGAGIAFKVGAHVKYTLEVYSYVTGFAVAMNPDSYKKLAPDLQKMIDESIVGREAEIGKGWDSIDDVGKANMMKEGMQPVRLSAEEDKKFRDIAKQVTEKHLKDMADKKLPAREVYDMMVKLAEKHTPTSRNFWK